MARSLSQCHDVIWLRAVKLARLSMAGRKPARNTAERDDLGRKIDRAFTLLIESVQKYDRAALAYEERMARWRRRSEAGRKVAQTRRRNQASGAAPRKHEDPNAR